MDNEVLEELEEQEETQETSNDTEQVNIDYSTYFDEIIENQETIITNLQLVNTNIVNSQNNNTNGFSVTSALIIMVFLIILLIGACRYFKRLF